MGAVSFGFGLFQLGVSLLPPSLTRLISILGFSTSRQNGIACLMYARLGVDMRAPLARFVHTVRVIVVRMQNNSFKFGPALVSHDSSSFLCH